MFCGRKGAKKNQPKITMPQPIQRNRNGEGLIQAEAPTVDLRAEVDEVNAPMGEVKIMEYLDTHVLTKKEQWCWVKRLFILNQDSLTCFYESAPHLQDKGKNVVIKIVIPIQPHTQPASGRLDSARGGESQQPNRGNLKSPRPSIVSQESGQLLQSQTVVQHTVQRGYTAINTGASQLPFSNDATRKVTIQQAVFDFGDDLNDLN